MKEPVTYSFSVDGQEKAIAACLRDDPMAQRALIKHYFGYVKSICLRYSNDNQDADEILNDSFLKVFSNLLKYDKSQPFKGWIRTITVNTAIDHYRKSIRIPENESIENLQVFDFDADIIDQLSAEEILQMVRSLTPAYRMVFSLFAIDGYSHKEIAEILGIKEGTSKSNLQDARRKLQAMMLKQNPTLYSAYEMKKSTRDEE